MFRLLVSCLIVLMIGFVPAAEKPNKEGSREALRVFNDLIGSWRATGTPEGTREEKQRGFWTESMDWQWQFKGDDAWLKVAFAKSKYFTKAELRYLPEKKRYQLTLTTNAKEALTFTGQRENRVVTFERDDGKKHETQRLVITLLHSNRFLYRYEVKPQGQAAFTRLYQVGATKEGVPFAQGDGRPECVVSGGLGRIQVKYKGETYYVCCTGCRDAFNDDPEKYLKEYRERKAKEEKENSR